MDLIFIKEGNDLIARYMEAKTSKCLTADHVKCFMYKFDNQRWMHGADSLRYHESWDALIPVLKKISKEEPTSDFTGLILSNLMQFNHEAVYANVVSLLKAKKDVKK